MYELKRLLKTIWHFSAATVLSLFIYLPISVALRAAERERIDDGGIFWVPIIVYIVCELIYLVIVWWMRFYNNDELEKAFLKEYIDKPWQGWRADLSSALKQEYGAYLLAYVLLIMNAASICMGIANPLPMLLYPMITLAFSLHPIIGTLISLAVFTIAYTFIVCASRNRVATQTLSSSGPVYSHRTIIPPRNSKNKQ